MGFVCSVEEKNMFQETKKKADKFIPYISKYLNSMNSKNKMKKWGDALAVYRGLDSLERVLVISTPNSLI